MPEYQGEYPYPGPGDIILKPGILLTFKSALDHTWKVIFKYDPKQTPGGVTIGVHDLSLPLPTESAAYEFAVTKGFVASTK